MDAEDTLRKIWPILVNVDVQRGLPNGQYTAAMALGLGAIRELVLPWIVTSDST
jgi:hypothetical protein